MWTNWITLDGRLSRHHIINFSLINWYKLIKEESISMTPMMTRFSRVWLAVQRPCFHRQQAMEMTSRIILHQSWWSQKASHRWDRPHSIQLWETKDHRSRVRPSLWIYDTLPYLSYTQRQTPQRTHHTFTAIHGRVKDREKGFGKLRRNGT